MSISRRKLLITSFISIPALSTVGYFISQQWFRFEGGVAQFSRYYEALANFGRELCRTENQDLPNPKASTLQLSSEENRKIVEDLRATSKAEAKTGELILLNQCFVTPSEANLAFIIAKEQGVSEC